MTVRPLTFVVGTGRCGSTALSRILRLHPDLLSVSELIASLEPDALPEAPLTGSEFWRILATPRSFANRVIRDGIPLPEYRYPHVKGRFSVAGGGIPAVCMMTLPHLTDDPDALFDALEPELSRRPAAPVAEHYRALFGLLGERFGRRAVVERSGYSLRSVPRLREAFPEARFVHLHRDGADCALSMSRHPGFRLIQLMTERATSTEDLPAGLAALLSDDEADLRPLYERSVPVAEFGALWSSTIVEGLGHLSRLPAAIRMSLSYEGLLDAPESELTRLAHHLGVEPLPQWLAAGRALLDGDRRGTAAATLPPAELTALRESCAPGARALSLAHGG
ncbi:sulfotransferase [Streptomyces iranensis]|uniref:sulfotransferase n=1 Tax=Streptomyces iranensis TaxID=576784 RepID=UPI0039B77504